LVCSAMAKGGPVSSLAYLLSSKSLLSNKRILIGSGNLLTIQREARLHLTRVESEGRLRILVGVSSSSTVVATVVASIVTSVVSISSTVSVSVSVAVVLATSEGSSWRGRKERRGRRSGQAG
jgi:hypothetical protein